MVHTQRPSARDYPVIKLEQKKNKSTVAVYLAGVDRVVAKKTEKKEQEQRYIAERQRRLGVLGEKINDVKRASVRLGATFI